MSNLIEDYHNNSVEVEFLRPSRRILDIGVGPGRYAFPLVDAASRNRVLACQGEEALLHLGSGERRRWVDLLFRYSEDPTTWGANQHVICLAEEGRPWEKTTPR